jgi:hypothetical protein
MLEEIGKIGDINSVNDFLHFNLSIKTIMIGLMLWGAGAFVFVIFLFGGINNTVDYVKNIINSTKKSIVINVDGKDNSSNDDSAHNDSNKDVNKDK